MAQTYQMKHNPQGTIYSLLTVESDGQMTMTFHGTDREICHEVTENADGWLCYPGAMFPGLESGKWNMMDDVVETTDNTDCTDNYAELEVIETNTNCTNYTNNEPVIVNPALGSAALPSKEPLTMNHDCQPRPRRQRKQSKPRVEHQPSDIRHQPSALSHQTSSTMKAIGMVAAATVALLVIYESGLLIPLGLIGLATSGLLK